jgi:hypothetical protein
MTPRPNPQLNRLRHSLQKSRTQAVCQLGEPDAGSGGGTLGVLVGSGRGAVQVFGPVRSPARPPKPGVRVATHRALHVPISAGYPIDLACSVSQVVGMRFAR